MEILKNPILIGSSDVVLDQELGNQIDTFDTIVRFNRAPSLNFEKYVGSTTTLRVVNNHVYLNIECPNEDPNFIPSVKNQIIGVVDSISSDKFYKVWDQSCTLIQLNERQSSLSNTLDLLPTQVITSLGNRGDHASVGLGTICYFINKGVKPTLYGFHLHDDNKNVAPHYWNIKPEVGPCHNYSYERKLIRKLIELDYAKLLS